MSNTEMSSCRFVCQDYAKISLKKDNKERQVGTLITSHCPPGTLFSIDSRDAKFLSLYLSILNVVFHRQFRITALNQFFMSNL